jgi:hypothetical protein
MYSDRVKCDKCGLMIIAQNKLIHEAQCNPLRNYQSAGSLKNNSLERNESKNTARGKDKIDNNFDDEFWFCNSCQNYLDKREKDDHILSHQYQDQFNGQDNSIVNGTDEIRHDDLNPIENISRNPFIRNRNRKFSDNTEYISGETNRNRNPFILDRDNSNMSQNFNFNFNRSNLPSDNNAFSNLNQRSISFYFKQF